MAAGAGLDSSLSLAARAVDEAEALVITAGAGMGVDSGLPDFRGPEGFWQAYPAFRDLGLRFEQLANPEWFFEDPALAWGFYGHRLNLYRRTVPHEGFATLLGWGSSSDASHLVRPPDDGAGLALAIERALVRAEVAPNDLGYLNPHATSTQAGDIAELRAMERALGSALAGIPLSATKSILGHLLGGAGAVETIATVCSVRDAVIHPSINLENKDAAFAAVDVVTSERPMHKRIALKLSAGFGGHNAAIVIGSAT